MNEKILLSAFLSDFDYPDYWWQIGALLLCLIGAKLLERYVRGRQDKTSHSLSQGGVKRLAFPLTGLLLVETARALLHVAQKFRRRKFDGSCHAQRGKHQRYFRFLQRAGCKWHTPAARRA